MSEPGNMIPDELEKQIARAVFAEELVETLTCALRFYADQWEQDVDAERTAHGWEGRIGDMEPSATLLTDRGERARTALAQARKE